jgi:hypothetical protein
VCAIAGVCDGWAMVVLASSDGRVWTEIADGASADGSRLGVDASPYLRASASSLDVSLGPGLHARLSDRREWPRRAFGPLGVAQSVPWLGQYWAPWLLGARVTGSFGSRALDGASVYAEKNWGAAFARHWWWGQAAFDGCGLAFAGGRIHGVAPTAIAFWDAREVTTLAPPLARTVTAARDGAWRVRASSPRWTVELEGTASNPLRLPVPIPREHRLEIRSNHYLLGDATVRIHRGRRLWFTGHTSPAALEDGATPPKGDSPL